MRVRKHPSRKSADASLVVTAGAGIIADTMALQRERPLSALRAARLRVGMSQVNLAARTGLSLGTIANAERAPRDMLSERTAQRCAQILGVKPEELLGYADEGAQP